MKFECSRKDFADALALAGAASSARSTLAILMCILIEASGSTVRLLGCDNEMWAERKLTANVEASGAVCVQTQVLQAIVSALPEGTLRFELENGQLVMEFGQSQWRLAALPAEEFPEIPPFTGQAELRLPMKELREAVDSVAFAVSEDHSRAVLTGVLFRYDGHELTLVSTDAHRLAVVKRSKDGIGSSVDAIVPEKALKAIKSLPLADGDDVVIQFDETRLAVDSGNAQVVSQLLSGVFPNWERVVPSEFTRTWKFDRQELIDNVNRAMILAKDSANRVRFSGQPEVVVITARSEDKGEAREEVASVNSNGEIDIAFNGRYVLDALKSMRSDGVRAELTESNRPAVFRPLEEDDEHYCVIMPMALH